MSRLALRTFTTSARRFTAAAPISVTSTRTNASAPLLGNIEASWKTLPADEQYEIYQQLEQLQKKDWKELTTDEKKAAYYVSFGPHGPRAPILKEGHGIRVFFGVICTISFAVGIFAFARSRAGPPPATMNAEYQAQMNEYMKSQNMNPISGVSSEGYKGKGMIQSK